MKQNNVCIIGLGYIGLTLAVTLAEKDFQVFGIEKNIEKLEQLKKGKPHFYEKGLNQALLKHKDKNLCLFDKIPDKEINTFIIAVGTPVDKTTKMPQMEYIKGAVNAISPYLRDGQLIVLRSTVPVGVTRNIVLPMLKQKNVCLSFCPERTAEGKALIELKELPQIIGALDQDSMIRSVEIFSRITPLIVKVSSLEAAEIIKLLDNSYRDLNFAYANQVALLCKDLNLDADEVIRSANSGYNRTNISLPGFVGKRFISQPGFVGGACLEKDPYILDNLVNSNYSLIKIAREINEGLPVHVLERIKKHLTETRISEAKIFISGFAFKGQPETDDLRGSSTIDLLNLLKKSEIKNIYGHDFVVKQEDIRKLGIEPCSIEQGFANADIAVFMNNHKFYQDIDIESLVRKMKQGAFLFDGWQLFSNKIKNIDIKYESLGFKK